MLVSYCYFFMNAKTPYKNLKCIIKIEFVSIRYIKHSKSDKMSEAGEVNIPTEMSKKTYTIDNGLHMIDVVDLDDNKYEFKTSLYNSDYIGIAILKHLHVEDFGKYIDYALDEIDIVLRDDIWHIELPVPFSEKCEYVALDEIDYKNQFDIAMVEVEQCKAKIEELNKKQFVSDYFISLFKNTYMEQLPAINSNIIIMFIGVPYIHKASVFCPYIMQAYKLSLKDIVIGEGGEVITDAYLKLSKFGFDENEEKKTDRFNLAGVLNTALEIKNYAKISSISMQIHKRNDVAYLTLSFDKSASDDRIFCNEIESLSLDIKYTECDRYGSYVDSEEVIKVYHK